MPNYLRAYCEAENVRAGKPGEPIRFVASSAGEKRDGKDLDPAKWDLLNYHRNPVVLWVHDYMGRNLPIGRATAFLEGGPLLADITFDQEDEFARQVEGKYRRGFLNTVSVGWDETEVGGQRRYDLLDISAVPVPGDPDALMERQYRALQQIYEAEPGGGGEAGWERVAARMAALFTRLADDTDAEREARYQALLPAYRRHGRTPPDFQAAVALKKLTPDLVRGLFLGGEPELYPEFFERAGAVLNSRNRNDLAQAVTLVQGVLERAVKEEAETTTEPDAEPDEDAIRQLQAIQIRLSNIGGTKQ